MRKYKLGLQLYTLREFIADDFEGTLKRVAEIGYDNVEFAGLYDMGLPAAKVKEILDKYHLECVSVHQPLATILSEGQKAIDYFKTIGVKYYTLPWCPPDTFVKPDTREQIKNEIETVGKMLYENGMHLQYHNHNFEFKKTEEGEYYIDWMYRTINKDLISPQFDTCWVKFAGEDPVKYINTYAGRMYTVHLKDFICDDMDPEKVVYGLIGTGSTAPASEKTGFKFLPLGKGIQDFPSIIEASGNAGIEYLIVEQDESEDAFRDVETSFKYLKSLGL